MEPRSQSYYDLEDIPEVFKEYDERIHAQTQQLQPIQSPRSSPDSFLLLLLFLLFFNEPKGLESLFQLFDLK